MYPKHNVAQGVIFTSEQMGETTVAITGILAPKITIILCKLLTHAHTHIHTYIIPKRMAVLLIVPTEHVSCIHAWAWLTQKGQLFSTYVNTVH